MFKEIIVRSNIIAELELDDNLFGVEANIYERYSDGGGDLLMRRFFGDTNTHLCISGARNWVNQLNEDYDATPWAAALKQYGVDCLANTKHSKKSV